MSTRACNALSYWNVRTLKELETLALVDFLKTPNCGLVTATEIRKVAATKGFNVFPELTTPRYNKNKTPKISVKIHNMGVFGKLLIFVVLFTVIVAMILNTGA